MSKREQKGLASLDEDRPAGSFEQLDSALHVISLPSWVLLAVVFLTIAAFGVFSFLYEAPLKVEGRGILLTKSVDEDDPLFQVTAPAAGRLSKVEVKIGEVVEPGATLGLIDQRELHDQIAEEEAEVSRLREEDQKLTELDDEAAKKKGQALARLELTLKRNLTLDQERLKVNRQISEMDSRLKKLGYLNIIDALKTRADADLVESGIGTNEAKLQELYFDRVDDETKRRGERLKRELGIRAAETKLVLLEERFQRDTRIISPFPIKGTVVDLMITPHALVEKGAPVALLRPMSRSDRPLEAIVFVPAGMGKRVLLTHKVEISPDTVRRHEHGYINGVVTSVSEIPATEMAMLAELKHKTLVSSFLERYSGQVLLCIHVELLNNPLSPGKESAQFKNRLMWSSASGSKQDVSNGTLCGAEIVVAKRPLIALALPWVKEMLGFY